MALYIPHSFFHLARLLFVRPETFGPYCVWYRYIPKAIYEYGYVIYVYIYIYTKIKISLSYHSITTIIVHVHLFVCTSALYVSHITTD